MHLSWSDRRLLTITKCNQKNKSLWTAFSWHISVSDLFNSFNAAHGHAALTSNMKSVFLAQLSTQNYMQISTLWLRRAFAATRRNLQCCITLTIRDQGGYLGFQSKTSRMAVLSFSCVVDMSYTSLAYSQTFSCLYSFNNQSGDSGFHVRFVTLQVWEWTHVNMYHTH